MEMAIQRAVTEAGFGLVERIERIGVGGESEIFRVDIQGGFQLVVRQYRRGAAERAKVEWGVLRHLASAGFPVPQVFGLSEDEALPGPALLMELLPGPTAASKRTIAQTTPLMLQLHKLDPLPLVGQVWPNRKAAGLLIDPLQWPALLGARTLEILAPALTHVVEALAVVSPEGPALLHTDWHGQNILYRADGSPIVIDWASAAIGDPRIDLGYTVAFYRIERMPEVAAEILAAYEAGRGAPVADLAPFEALGALRRLGLFLTLLEEGGERLGFQPEAIARLREGRGYVTWHLEYLEAVTGLSLPVVTEAIATW